MHLRIVPILFPENEFFSKIHNLRFIKSFKFQFEKQQRQQQQQQQQKNTYPKKKKLEHKCPNF